MGYGHQCRHDERLAEAAASPCWSPSTTRHLPPLGPSGGPGPLQGETMILTDHTPCTRSSPYLALLAFGLALLGFRPTEGLPGVGAGLRCWPFLAGSLGRSDATAMAPRSVLLSADPRHWLPCWGWNRRWLRAGCRGCIAPAWRSLQALQRLAGVGDTPLDMQRLVVFKLAPSDQCGRAGWGPQLGWWSCSPPAGRRTAMELARSAERAQPGNAASAVIASRPKRVAFGGEATGPGADPVFCCGPEPLANHGR